MHILIADDDAVCRESLAAMVSLLGDPVTVEDGTAAVAAVRAALAAGHGFDLIFLDVLMPGLDGLSTLRSIRAAEAERGLHGLSGARVVMTTCVDDRRQVMSAFRGQAEAYLIKPVEMKQLQQVLVTVGVLPAVAQR